MPHHHHKRSRRLSFIDPSRIEALLRPLLSDPHEREFVLRCLLQEGPEHHRGANYVLLALFGELAAQLAPSSDGLPIPMHLPPHLESDAQEKEYPLRIPSRVLERLAAKGTREFSDILECVTDGPPQHSISNALMLCLLDALLEKK